MFAESITWGLLLVTTSDGPGYTDYTAWGTEVARKDEILPVTNDVEVLGSFFGFVYLRCVRLGLGINWKVRWTHNQPQISPSICCQHDLALS